MKIITLIVFMLMTFGVSKASDSTFTIKGKFDKVKSGKVYLTIYAGSQAIRDSATIKDGKFEFKGTQKEPVSAMLSMDGKRGDYLQFFIEPTDMKIKGDG